MVFGADQIPGRDGLPGRLAGLFDERIGGDRSLRGGQDGGFGLGEVVCQGSREDFRLQVPVRDALRGAREGDEVEEFFGVETRFFWIFGGQQGQQGQQGLTLVGDEGVDVDECLDVLVAGRRVGGDRAAEEWPARTIEPLIDR